MAEACGGCVHDALVSRHLCGLLILPLQLLATSLVLAYAPLLLLLAARWPAFYVRQRQPLVAAMKASQSCRSQPPSSACILEQVPELRACFAVVCNLLCPFFYGPAAAPLPLHAPT